VPSHRHLTSVPVSTAIRAPPVVALNRNPPRRAGSTRCQTTPLEVGRSSSQSALSERPGRWNGRVSERRQPLPSRGGEVYDLPSCPACEGMLGRSESPPRRGRRREGRTTVPAGPQLRAVLPSRREASALGASPACTVPHASRGLCLERDCKRVPLAGARLPREERERGTFLVVRHADACTAVQKFSQPLEWLRSRPSPGRTGSRRWRRRGRSRRRTGSRRSCGGRRSRRAAGRRNA